MKKPTRRNDLQYLREVRNLPCLGCGSVGNSEAHHVKTWASGGGDDVWNIIPLDRWCHAEIHHIGLTRFAERHTKVKTWLLDNKWEFCNVKNKWLPPKQTA